MASITVSHAQEVPNQYTEESETILETLLGNELDVEWWRVLTSGVWFFIVNETKKKTTTKQCNVCNQWFNGIWAAIYAFRGISLVMLFDLSISSGRLGTTGRERFPPTWFPHVYHRLGSVQYHIFSNKKKKRHTVLQRDTASEMYILRIFLRYITPYILFNIVKSRQKWWKAPDPKKRCTLTEIGPFIREFMVCKSKWKPYCCFLSSENPENWGRRKENFIHCKVLIYNRFQVCASNESF